jgi:hypothetical protein
LDNSAGLAAAIAAGLGTSPLLHPRGAAVAYLMCHSSGATKGAIEGEHQERVWGC